MAGIKVIGGEAFQRKLAALGKDGPKAQRYGMSQGAQFAVKMFRWTAPSPGKNEFSTGATKKAVNRVEQRPSPDVHQQWIGIKDISVPKKMYMRKLFVNLDYGDEDAKFIAEYSPKKNKAMGFVHEVNVVKKPFFYSFIQEKHEPWFYPTWRSIYGQVVNISIRKTDDKIKELLAKKGA